MNLNLIDTQAIKMYMYFSNARLMVIAFILQEYLNQEDILLLKVNLD